MQVYLSLCCALIASAAGAYLHLLWNIGGLLTTFACMGSMFWLLSTPPHQEVPSFSLSAFFFFFNDSLSAHVSGFYTSFFFFGKQQKRVALLMMAALFEGASIGPLIDLAIEIDPRYAPIFSKFGSCILCSVVY